MNYRLFIAFSCGRLVCDPVFLHTTASRIPLNSQAVRCGIIHLKVPWTTFWSLKKIVENILNYRTIPPFAQKQKQTNNLYSRQGNQESSVPLGLELHLSQCYGHWILNGYLVWTDGVSSLSPRLWSLLYNEVLYSRICKWGFCRQCHGVGHSSKTSLYKRRHEREIIFSLPCNNKMSRWM